MVDRVDLRSDTVTRPTEAMLDAMRASEVGDDVLGDDPTVHALEARVAELFGKEAACFVPSGTMANQSAIRAQTEPGDEVVCHELSHIVHYESGAPAALSGVMIRPVRGERGTFTGADVGSMVRPRNHHFARTRLVSVENTCNGAGGAVWGLDRLRDVTDAAKSHGLRAHLDGARLWNACAASGVSPAEYASGFDSVSCCFSKGLGSPAGSAVAGDEETIYRVRRVKKMLGGAMRQAGYIAGACLHALEHHRERLAEDHANASRLASGLAEIDGLAIDAGSVETNMVLIDIEEGLADAPTLCASLDGEGVRVLPVGPRRIRAVTHLDVDRAGVDRAIEVFGAVLSGKARV